MLLPNSAPTEVAVPSGSGSAADPGDEGEPYWLDLDVGPTPRGEDLLFGPVTFYRQRSPDGLLPEVFDPGDGGPKAVRLAVRAGAYVGPLYEPADVANDRCELRGPKQRLGVEVWNAFSIRVPPSFPRRPLRCVVAQMKMPYDAGGDGSPAFALRLDDGRWLATVEHLYELSDEQQGLYLSASEGGRCGERQGAPALDHSNFNKHDGVTDYQVRAFVATDAEGLPGHVLQDEATSCTTGVRVERHADLPAVRSDGRWTDFALRMRSSGRRGVDGLVELHADGVLVARVTGEFGYPDVAAMPAVQYFKVGPYRNNDPLWGPDAAALEYRDIRRGRTLDEVRLAAPLVASITNATAAPA